MPYYIKKGCGGKDNYWSVISSGGKEHGCHATKKAAIDQAVAISISTKEPFKGEKRSKAVKESFSESMNEAVEEYVMLNERQQSLAKDLAENAVEYGMFDQTTGANGSHYTPANVNPFKAEGMICMNCVFYSEEAKQCQIVEGILEDDAICKFWVIPEILLKPEAPIVESISKKLIHATANLAKLSESIKQMQGK